MSAANVTVMDKPGRKQVTQRKHWQRLLNDLFCERIPRHCEWDAHEQILDILNRIAGHAAENHLLFPAGNGMDLLGVQESNEPDCIELLFQRKDKKGAPDPSIVTVVKPSVLSFDSFGAATEWSYFRLDAAVLEPSGVGYMETEHHEQVMEVEPDWYVGLDDGKKTPWPPNARLVTRILKGSMVIFGKASPFHTVTALEAYQAHHAKLSMLAFRKHIATMKYESEF